MKEPADVKVPLPFNDEWWLTKTFVLPILKNVPFLDIDKLAEGTITGAEWVRRRAVGSRQATDSETERERQEQIAIEDSFIAPVIAAAVAAVVMSRGAALLTLPALVNAAPKLESAVRQAMVLATPRGMIENRIKYWYVDHPGVLESAVRDAWQAALAPYMLAPKAAAGFFESMLPPSQPTAGRLPSPRPGPSPVPAGRGVGGPITGAGSGTSDSIQAWLSNGEWVIRAGAVGALGDSVLGMLNQWDQLSPEQRAAVGDMLVPGSALRRDGGGVVGEPPLSDEEAKEQRAEITTQIDAMSRALGEAQSRLRAAQAALDAYNESVAAGIRLGNDLADAVGAQSKAQDALTDAVKKQTDAQRQLAVAKASGTDAQVASATRALAEADQAVAAAKDASGGFLSFLQQGADAAAKFAAQIDSLRAAGASSEVVQKIAQLGAASGGSAAAELLSGGSSAITQANYLVQLVAELSKATGQSAAQQYYGPAVSSAQSAVNAINATIANLNTQLAAISPHAAGGIVTAPTIALVGEAGPEAIIPLNRAGRLTAGTAVNVSLTVHGSVVQESDLVVTVRDGIAQLMRRRGLDPAIIGV